MIDLALAYNRDFIAPTLKRRKPEGPEAAALERLDRELAALAPDAPAEDIQNIVYTIGNEGGFENLRDWFKALYETLLGSSAGPRMGSFIALYGVDNSRKADSGGIGMSGYHLAQINVGRFIHLRDDPANADFMAGLDPVNAQADIAPGFVWRLIGDGNDATDLVPDESDPQLLVNMSVWADVEALGAFVYRNSDHLSFMRRRKEWFEKIDVFQALWWVPVGHVPSVAEGMARVALLKANGPSADAFTFRHTFPAPDGMPAAPVLDECA